MNGTVILEAITDIDDTLIERAQNYRPHGMSRARVVSGVMAAALVLMVGTFAVSTLRMGKSHPESNACLTDKHTYDDAGQQGMVAMEEAEVAGELKPAENEKKQDFDVTNDMTATDTGALEDEQTECAEGFAGAVITVGELYGYKIEIRDIVMGEYFISEYKIYVTKEEESAELSQSPLDEQQRREAEKLVEEYLLKEGMR